MVLKSKRCAFHCWLNGLTAFFVVLFLSILLLEGAESALAEDTISNHPDGIFIECNAYNTSTAQKIDITCIGMGVPPMRNYNITRGLGCTRNTYKNGKKESVEPISGDPVISESAGDCSTD
jgi:hypothetical protein